METDLKIPEEYLSQIEFYQRCVNENKYIDHNFVAEQRDDMEFGLDAYSAFYYSALTNEPCPCREPVRLTQLLAASYGVNSLVETTAWDLLQETMTIRDFESWCRNSLIPNWLTREIYNKKIELKALG